MNPVHIIMTHYNGGYDVVRSYISLMERTMYPFNLTIIDDGSIKEDPGYIFIKGLENSSPDNVKVILGKTNFGKTRMINEFINFHPNSDVVLVDSDIEIQTKMWLNEIVDFSKKNENAGIISPICVKQDFITVDSIGKRLFLTPDENKNTPNFEYEIAELNGVTRFVLPIEPIEIDAAPGGCTFYSRKLIDKVGKMNLEFHSWMQELSYSVEARIEDFKVFSLPNIAYAHYETKENRPFSEARKIRDKDAKLFKEIYGVHPYDPAPYWDEVKKRFHKTNVLWRYQ